jgi:hypothetical protein
MVCFAALVAYKVERAFDVAMWAAEHVLGTTAETAIQLGNEAIQRQAQMGAGIMGLVLCVFGYRALRSARDVLRPADESSGGEAKIVWQTEQPRAGLPLEGSLRLREMPKPEQVYRLELSCKREYQPGAEELKPRKRVETAFVEQRDIQVVQTAEGWSVPFRFDIPVTAPASTGGSFPQDGYVWRLAFYRADALIAFPAGFGITMGPAPAGQLRALEAAETPEQKAAVAAVSEVLRRDSLLPHERAEARSLTPADVALLRKAGSMGPKLMKWFFIVFLGIPTVGAILVFAFAAFFAK